MMINLKKWQDCDMGAYDCHWTMMNPAGFCPGPGRIWSPEGPQSETANTSWREVEKTIEGCKQVKSVKIRDVRFLLGRVEFAGSANSSASFASRPAKVQVTSRGIGISRAWPPLLYKLHWLHCPAGASTVCWMLMVSLQNLHGITMCPAGEVCT